MTGKVPLEEGLIDRHVFDADNPPGPLDLDVPVYQQERVTVGDDVQDPADVHHGASVAVSGTGEPAGQRNITLVARLGGDDVRLDAATDQGQVTQDIPCFVAHELVGPTQRPTDEPILGEDESGFHGCAQRQAPSPKRVGLAQKPEGARRGQLTGKSRRGDVVGAGLSADERMIPLDRRRQPE